MGRDLIPIGIDAETAQAIELGARFCRTLASVERAHSLEDEADFHGILDNVDPIDVMLAANVLQSLWQAYTLLKDVGSEPQATERTPLRAIVSSTALGTDGPGGQSASEPAGFSVRVAQDG